MIVTDILLDGLFAAVAAIGFGAISDPPMRAFPRIALLAAIGHALRFTLIHCAALDIATASLFAAFAIGMGSLWLGRGVTALTVTAVLVTGVAAIGTLLWGWWVGVTVVALSALSFMILKLFAR